MDFVCRSKLTGDYHHRNIPITAQEYRDWLYAQPDDPKWFASTAFPHLSDDEVDFLVAGVIPEERKALLREEGLDDGTT